MSIPPTLGIGLAVVVFNKQGQFLLGLRQGSHASGVWAFPGGAVDLGEDPYACAIRELAEETSLVLRNPKTFPWWSYDDFGDKRRDITVFVTGEAIGNPVVVEPSKCGGWRWCSASDTPRPLFPGIEELLVSGLLWR